MELITEKWEASKCKLEKWNNEIECEKIIMNFRTYAKIYGNFLLFAKQPTNPQTIDMNGKTCEGQTL